MSELERGAARRGQAATGETAATPVRPAPSPQPARHPRVSNLSRWIDRDRQLHYAGPLAPQDRYPGRIATQ
jgi:hypothetical protein